MIPYHTTPHHSIPLYTIPYHYIPYHTISLIIYHTISLHTIPLHTILYPMLRKIQPIRGQDYRCIFCGMQRVVFHSTFPSFLARNSSLGSIWGLLKSELRNLLTPANHYEHFRSHPEIVSEDFWTLPKISEDFPKILKTHKDIWKFVLNRFRKFPKISEHLRRFFENFRRSQKHLENTFELFPKYSKRFITR